ncbi:MAG TPA: DUF882 domain-containing protein [Polyangia bacterium]|jgi:uncharacterized protein YcbK (DUF882 family)|nr:DUF882 domain-containing protein [Polyangia bacterium]
MGGRPQDSIAEILKRIRKQAVPPRRERRLRIMIASDPQSPIRTLTLPRALPTLVTLAGAGLLVATILLLCGSWRMSTSMGGLERRVRSMMQAADTVALHPLREGEAHADGHHAALRAPSGEIGHFLLESANTGESMDVRINLASGEIEPGSYRQLRHLLRCLRTGAETPPDPRLLEVLYRISQRTRQKIILVSGFRAPMFSKATLSYHTRGMAADIRVPGMTPLMVRDLAFAMGVKGIGYYPVSEFVHLDVRPDQQYWIDYGQNSQDGERTEHDPSHGESEGVPLAEVGPEAAPAGAPVLAPGATAAAAVAPAAVAAVAPAAPVPANAAPGEKPAE